MKKLKIRNVGNEPKVTTFVKVEQELVLSANQVYDVIATLDHIGSSPYSGHYVTFLKQHSGQWKLFDDERSKMCTLRQANTRNNYILVFKKKSVMSETIEIKSGEEDLVRDGQVLQQGKENLDIIETIILIDHRIIS